MRRRAEEKMGGGEGGLRGRRAEEKVAWGEEGIRRR